MPTPITGNPINLYLDISTTTTPTWKMVACLTALTFNGAGNVIDAGSKCGQAKLAGENDDTVDFEGNFEMAPTADQVSFTDLMNVYQSKESRHWKMSTADGVQYYREFNGPLTSYTEDLPYNEVATFSGTIGINGVVIDEAPTT